jgi:hypothetical protein
MARLAGKHRLALALAAGIVIIWLASMFLLVRAAALPPQAEGNMLAVFEPGTTEDDIFASLVAAGGKPVRRTWLPFVWIVSGNGAGFVARLEREGALGAYDEFPFAPALAGCFAYADAKLAGWFTLRP